MASSYQTEDGQLEGFSKNFFATISKDTPGNVFLSPASVALAMSMCTVGARKKTLEQMLSALQVSTTKQLERSSRDVMEIFSAAANDRQVTLRLANRLYVQKAYKLQDDYLKTVRQSFSADVESADFARESDRIVGTINSWVEQQTNNLIKNLLSPSDVNADTRLIIVNCIYFKGTWKKKFSEKLTKSDADFYEENGQVSKISLMHVENEYPYAFNEELRVQVADLPYKSDSMSANFVLTVILPEKNVSLSEVEQKLNNQPALMKKVLTQRQGTNPKLLMYLPKFKMETTFNLNGVLQQMGMQDAFNAHKADFTGIVGPDVDKDGLYISKVIHKAFIDVNELGSEAAAATAVVMLKCASIMRKANPIEFKADHPFLFFIRETYSNTIIFSGKFFESTS